MQRNPLLKKYHKLLEFIFYSNYFYGVCAVVLSVEAMLQQHSPINSIWYFFLVFMITVLYYAYPYIKRSEYSSNPRTNWYSRNYTLMRYNQIVITVILSAALILFLLFSYHRLLNITLVQWSLIFIFPIVAALYYGLHAAGKYNLRKTGWLKPFVIGFAWAGPITIYPVLFYDIIHDLDYELNTIAVLLFLKNFMFISVLCIIFDIKDYATDYVNRLKTFVVKIGLRKTMFYLLLPLSLVGLVSFIFYAVSHQFNYMKILLNTVPFVLLLIVTWSLHKRKSLMYYLAVVDGLMLVKAVCGSIAILYF